MKRIISYILTMVIVLSTITGGPVRAVDSNITLYHYDGYTVEYKVKSQWDYSQSIGVKLTNTSTEPILNWAVKYETNGTISELSNAVIYEQTDSSYILKNAGYNYEIQPNQSVSFTYTVTGQDLSIPFAIELVSKKVEKQDGFEVKYKITDDWDTGFQADVTISNQTEQPIEAWSLSFDGNFLIDNVWNGRIIINNGSFYTISSQSWTNVIPANSSFTFSFTGTKDLTSKAELKNFVLTEVMIAEESNNLDDGIIDQGVLEELIALGKVEVIRGNDGSFRVIDGNFTGKRVNSISDAADVLNLANSLFGERFIANASEITVQSLESDGKAGKEDFYRYTPTVNGIPALGGQIVLVVNGNGIVQSLFNTYDSRIHAVNTAPTITEQEAIDVATESLLSEERLNDLLHKIAEQLECDYDMVKTAFLSTLKIDTDLLIFAALDEEVPTLTWSIQFSMDMDSNEEESILEESELDEPVLDETELELLILPLISERIYITANGSSVGSVLATDSNMQGLSSVTLEADDLLDSKRSFEAQKENEQYTLRDNGRNIETYKTINGGFFGTKPNFPGKLIRFKDPKFLRKDAVSAHANVAYVYDYYNDILGRRSYDGKGATIISSIDYKFRSSVWDRELKQIIFNRGKEAAALDSVGHEFTHAVVQHIIKDDKGNGIGFYGSNEPGSLSEAYADIMGNLIENKSDEGRWQFAEDSGEDIRDMSKPSNHNHPEHYGKTDFSNGKGDNGGIHSNNGVFNFATYKMMTDSRMSSISNELWAKIFYHSIFRLSYSSKFLDARGAIISTAKAFQFNSIQQQAIKDAFDAVGISEEDSIRIVLRWGLQPRDLDSHLVGPAIDGNGKFHVYFANRNYYQSGGKSKQYAVDLDYDNTSSYGPEIITINTLTPGDYYFYVHDFTNSSAKSSTALAKSGANVRVYSGSNNTQIQRFDINPSSSGTLWEVFKLTIIPEKDMKITPVNAYSYHSNTSTIGN